MGFTELLSFILVGELCVASIVIFSRKFGFHNLFIITLPISRLGFDIGFQLKAFHIFLLPLLFLAFFSTKKKFMISGKNSFQLPVLFYPEGQLHLCLCWASLTACLLYLSGIQHVFSRRHPRYNPRWLFGFHFKRKFNKQDFSRA